MTGSQGVSYWRVEGRLGARLARRFYDREAAVRIAKILDEPGLRLVAYNRVHKIVSEEDC